MTACANARGSSAMTVSRPCVTGSPSAPIVVETTALPIAMASKIFSLVPPPMRSGTMYTVPAATCGRTSSTRPVTSMPARSASFCTAGVGARPMMLSVTSGTLVRMCGRMSLTKYSIPSSLGSQSIDPVKTKCGR